MTKSTPTKETLKNAIMGFSVDDWLKIPEIEEKDQEEFPNAKIAADIKKSPLYKVL